MLSLIKPFNAYKSCLLKPPKLNDARNSPLKAVWKGKKKKGNLCGTQCLKFVQKHCDM